MGLTGTGKSTFIKRLTNSDIVIDHGLRSCTVDIGIHGVQYRNGQTIFLVDTPGFNDTTRTDTQVLKDVAYFLGATYDQKIKLAGVIYLHITTTRMTRSALENLAMFQALCGTSSLKNVVLMTTKWDACTTSETIEKAERNDKELKTSPDFWGDMIEFGSVTFRHNGTRESALRAIGHIMQLRSHTVLDIQRQMIEQKKPLDQTTAGQELQKEMQRKLLEQQRAHEERVAGIQQSHKTAMEASNKKLADKMAQLERDAEEDRCKQKLQAEKDAETLKQTHERLQKDQEAKFKRLQKQYEKDAAKLKAENDRKQASNAQLQQRSDAMTQEVEQLKRQPQQNNELNQWEASLAASGAEMEKWKLEIEQRNKELEIELARTRSGTAVSLFSILAGGVLAAAGVATANPALVAAGTSVIGTTTVAHARRNANA